MSARFCVAVAILVSGFATLEVHAADDSTEVVNNYADVFERLTQELVFKLEKSPVLLIWCFDESESMKNDQKEIRDRLVRVYAELKRVEGLAEDHLLSAVTSYGAHFHVQTSEPTANVDELRQAINSVPIDKTGKELMCSAIGRAVVTGRRWLRDEKRKMMIIMVTDESGDPADNQTKLEPAIAEAKASNCAVYFLAQQATFGSPFGYLRWRHPQTRRVHWLKVDRGPETAFVQVLQTDGFGPRRDAFASGLGPYAQMRLVRETQGVFLMLPSVGLPSARQTSYKLEVLRRYRPDWRPRAEIIADRDRDPLQSQLWKVIDELNPHNPDAAKTVGLRTAFSPQLDQLQLQVKTEGAKIDAYLERLIAAEKSLQAIQDSRNTEKSARWRANYDLTRAQLAAFRARVYAYRGCLDEFVADPKPASPTKKPDFQLESWRISTVRANNVAESTKEADRAAPLLRNVIRDHPGTPWARMADWELKRGFGVTLRPHYEPPRGRAPAPIRPPIL